MDKTLWSENDEVVDSDTYCTLIDVKMIEEEERCKVA